MGWVALPSDQQIHMAAISVGKNPSFEDSETRLIEAHLLDYNGEDFYGARIRVLLCAFIRPSYKFENMDELIQAIEEDCQYTRKWLVNDETIGSVRDDPFLRNYN